MYTFLKDTADKIGLDFHYARRDYANLYQNEGELELLKTQLFLDPVTTETIFDDYGNKVSQISSGHFMLLKHSDFQEDDYEERFLKYIKPLVTEVEGKILAEIGCYRIGINFWQTIEVVNALDFNGDGLIINYQIIREL